MPHPSRHVRSIGASLVIATTDMSATTVYWEKVEVPIKWSKSLPLHLNLDVPSGITPFPCVALIFPQRFVLPDLQNLHSLHSGVLHKSSVTAFRDQVADILKRNNVISRLDRGDALPNGFYDTSTLMAKNNRESSLGILSRKCVCI